MKAFGYKLLSFGAGCLAGGLVLVALVVGAYYYVEPTVPDAAALEHTEEQVPLQMFTRDGLLMNQYGEQKRTPVDLDEIPQVLIDAFLAAEDDTFYEHPGFNIPGIVRAGYRYVLSGNDRVAGASTITQQVAREYFSDLDYRDYSPWRKFKELIVAIRIEREFSKDDILELFLNTTFLGQRSYGVVAAARTYFDKSLDELTLAEAALLAGIPQSPSNLNPVADPEAARRRRGYVLGRMRTLGMITRAEYDAASAVPVYPTEYGPKIQVDAPYVSDLVWEWAQKKYGEATARTGGLRITTSIDSRLQAIANAATRQGLLMYDERHGYRGPDAHLSLPEPADGDVAVPQALDDDELAALLADYPPRAGFPAALVLGADESSADVFMPSRGHFKLGLEAMAWAKRFIDDDRWGSSPKTVDAVLARGDVIRLRTLADGSLHLTQVPEVQGAIVALDPADGAVAAMTGGFDGDEFPYNRAVAARRQPGSAFKAFTYSAALNHGFTLVSRINDAPITLPDPEQERLWRPQNYSGTPHGLVPVREALEESYNYAAVRIVLDVGLDETVDYVRRFGFDEQAAPRSPAMALGAGGVAPVDLAAGYAVFANGGFRVVPYFVDRVEDLNGTVLFERKPAFACEPCERESPSNEVPGGTTPKGTAGESDLVSDVTDLYEPIDRAERIITPQNAFLVTQLLHGVIQRGTGKSARELGRHDIVGKTGTTNDLRDAWFAGFNADLVAVSWVGFDDFDRELGRGEQGAVTALPLWKLFMADALDGDPEHVLPEPLGVRQVRINPESGLIAREASSRSRFEWFEEGTEPAVEAAPATGSEYLDSARDEPRKSTNETIF